MSKEDRNLYKELIIPVLNVMDFCLKEGEEEVVSFCIDAFNYLAESKLTILDSHFTSIIEYLC